MVGRRDAALPCLVLDEAKRREWLLQGDIAERALELIGTVAKEKSIRLKECATMVDYVHLLIEVEDRTDLAKAKSLLKGASSRRLLQQFPGLKLDAGVSHFWQKRYGARPVEPSALAGVAHHIRTQNRRPGKYER